MRDALEFNPNLIFIDLIQINEEHNKGQGSKLLTAFTEKYKNKFIILEAGLLEEIDNPDDILYKLSNFYKKNGFININHRIGFCEERIVFGFNNKTLRDSLGIITGF